MGSEPVSASYVMLQLSIFKNEIVESIRNEMKTVFREEIDKLRTELRTEMDQKISDLKVEQQEFTNKKIDEMERAHLQRAQPRIWDYYPQKMFHQSFCSKRNL